MINNFTNLEQNDEHIHLSFLSPKKILSSAILNGGFIEAEHILNKNVPLNFSSCETPNKSLIDYAKAKGWKGNVVGMMTAASMNTLCIEQVNIEGVDISVLITAGISNARRAGDKADIQELLTVTKEVGTINLILICSARLTNAAMVEAVMLATEAKAAALQEANILSPISEKLATGTGTDAIVVVSGDGPQKIEFCGKHVLFGEVIGRLVISALRRSLATT
ncbi:MAG: adenosylcobinamide amidohydrolase [Arcobacter sp.]|uniref:adenosylcobinamide amidohydrolase n=1 Tax=Arcobacter sp. TaxID=1872629 RepID=UPI003AFFAA69